MSGAIEVHTEEHTLSPDKNSISFFAYVDGRKVDCVITLAALKSHFHSGDKTITDVFTENQEAIGTIAAYLINAKPQKVDGHLLIDLENMQEGMRRTLGSA